MLSIAEIRTVQQMMTCPSRRRSNPTTLSSYPTSLKRIRAVNDIRNVLLDASSDFNECGERLFVHKNTVKYRISKINEALGYDMTNAAEAYEVYLAMILYRLVTNE